MMMKSTGITVWMQYGIILHHLKFNMLSKIAKLVLCIAHSNAGEEREFSMTRKNKIPFSPNLALDITKFAFCKVQYQQISLVTDTALQIQ